jgi:hypothetical protein
MAVTARLESFFDGAAGKQLSAVEANPMASHQHEFNGVSTLKELLGEPPGGGLNLRTRFVFLDDELEPESVLSTLTWYDARARHPSRSELRLYYTSNYVMDGAGEGDYVLIAKLREDVDPEADAVVIVCPGASSTAAQLQTLFGLECSDRLDVEVLPSGRDLTLTERLLIESLGYEVPIVEENALEEMIAVFGGAFPTTKRFSAFARARLNDVDPLSDPDGALMAWMDHEETLFRTLERHVLGDRLRELSGDVGRTLELAMQTFQRRRARAGRALENHVAIILTAFGIEYEPQAYTEGRKQPDFLFPGSLAYHDPEFPEGRLRVLAVKTTCKDRWRQVLSEADRVPRKHLLTLEAPISVAQTDEMASRSVALVLPIGLHHLFEPKQQFALTSLRTLLEELRVR